MQPPHHHPRINLDELKAQIMKKLGPEGSKQYFYYLHAFLSLKMNKVEFNKLCLKILGRENIPLHNQFIRSILKNACSAKSPPPPPPPPQASHKDDVLKHVTHVGGKDVSANGSHMLSNGGDMLLPVSPRKARTGSRDRRSGDRLSALAPKSTDFNPLPKNGIFEQNKEFPVVKRLQDDLLAPVHSKNKNELVVRNESPLQAPLGVPFCHVSTGGAHRASSSSSKFICDDALLDSSALREKMENIAVAQGIEGVSVDCANVINHGLDSYLKGLIRSCIQLVGSRNNNAHNKQINGVKEQRVYREISLQDFRVAMEMNPRQLGEDWPLLLEKICTRAFEE